MKVTAKYAYDVDQNIYVSEGTLPNGSLFYGDGETIDEMIQATKDCMMTNLMDQEEEYNSIQESLGSFKKYQFPEIDFVKTILEEVR